jgi:hypothetical protein
MPFILLFWTNIPKSRFPVLVLFACYAVIVLLFEVSLNFGLFNLSFSFSDLVSRFLVPDELASITRGIFAAAAVGLVVLQ